MLRSTEAPICRQTTTLERSAARIRGIGKTVSATRTPVNRCPLLVFQARSHELQPGDARASTKDFVSLGKVLKGSAVQAVFSSVPWLETGIRHKEES